jgi:putative FmdB family regulatory protein
MPTYEYICAKCKHTFETVQPITAKALTVCPRDLCPKKPWGKGKVKRAIGTGGGLIFKGSGFYTTDYRSDKYKAAAKKDDAGAISSSSSEGAKKEGKAAASGGSTGTAGASATPAASPVAPAPPKKS